VRGTIIGIATAAATAAAATAAAAAAERQADQVALQQAAIRQAAIRQAATQHAIPVGNHSGSSRGLGIAYAEQVERKCSAESLQNDANFHPNHSLIHCK
jgi:hypothetical protein